MSLLSHSLRALLLFSLFAWMPTASAKVVWLVGKDAAVNAPAVAEQLSHLLAEEPVEVVSFSHLSAWSMMPDAEGKRTQLLAAEHLLVTPAAGEPDGLAFLGLTTVQAMRPIHLPKTTLVAVQKPVYKMSGLCENLPLQETARLAIGANIPFVPLPKVWQQVYTDDTFYNGKVPKGAISEAYVYAAGLALALRGDDYELPALGGIHPELADELKTSIREGLELTEDVLYAAAHLPAGGFNVRVGDTFDAILYDGAFERKIGAWLEAIATADGRTLTLHYTTDTSIDTGWPCLFRSTHTLGKMPKASVYTRPAFEDDSGREELKHLELILKTDLPKKGWMPFPLAIAEWTRRCPDLPVYEGALPTEATAAMFATMLYLKWTGTVVIPPNSDQRITTAMDIGLDVMLRQQRLRKDVNAIFCRAVGERRFAFSLWRRPAEEVTVRLATDPMGQHLSTKKLRFNDENYWSPQTVTVEAPCTFYWKVPAKQFPGQNTGARTVR